MTYWYRFEEQSYASVDEDGECCGWSYTVLHLRKMKVIRETPCGVKLIGMGYGPSNPRLVLHSWGKKFALPTIEEAAVSFRARKARQISIYQARITKAERALDVLNRQEWQEGIDW